MAENNKNKSTTEEHRVKVLSPSTLVIKSFMRNRLALVGFFIIISMFAFAFIGGFLTPYGESEVFRKYETQYKDYAGVSYNEEYQYEVVEGVTLPKLLKADMILAIGKGESQFTSDGVVYTLIEAGEEFYRIVELSEVATALTIKGVTTISGSGSFVVSEEFKSLYSEAEEKKEASFLMDGITYSITKAGRETKISVAKDLAIASKLVYSGSTQDTALSYEFKVESHQAMAEKKSSFEADGQTYTVDMGKDGTSAVFYLNKEEYATASRFTVRAVGNGVFLPLEFKTAVQDAVEEGASSFVYNKEDGTEESYKVTRKDKEYTVQRETSVQVNNTYEAPSKKHWLGTDGYGMDLLTRLMYGGRISLLIGFIVVVLEIILGVVIGGLAGYFGKWVDSVCMRIVDIFNCIPAMPLYIIFGSIMDYLEVDPSVRIYFLCLILGLLSWPQVARMVRGQILSLREQEFMIAAEATGISTFRKIFKHLIPNVIPQLIVIATMGLGSVILTEAALSFFGLGVKFPYASWGNIVNAVNDIYVMTEYWFVWVPAGLLILITVLGFNFVGDGLRDAFDPKMKR